MSKRVNKLGLIGTALLLAAVGSTTVFALPSQAEAHAQQAGSNISTGSSTTTAGTTTTSTSTATSRQPSQAVSGQAKGQAHMTAGQLKGCQNRESAINNIMSRINTRANNQITLFATIATRVEAFYVKQGKTVSNYAQLVQAVTTAQAKATSDFATVKTVSNFSCSSSDPKATVDSFQGYLKTEISDLQSFKLAVKNLIVGVASANGVTVSASATTTTQGSK